MTTNTKIVHVFDDDKFIDPAISIFEATCPKISSYLVIRSENETDFKYVRSNLAQAIQLETEADYARIAKTINDSTYKIVFFHALNNKKHQLLKRIESNVVCVWFIWGYDLYTQWKPFERMIYQKHTLRFIDRHLTVKDRLFNFILYKLKTYRFLFGEKTFFYNNIKKIDLVAPVVPTEMEYIETLNRSIKYAPFSYVCLEHMLGDEYRSDFVKNNNIVVGNSATPTNNHIEVFLTLSKLNLGDRKVIVPLNYGDKGEYLQLVLKRGHELLGENFHPITKFLPLKEYHDLTLNSGYLIFNHIRQQGVANVVAMGYSGTKLFFNGKSSVYKHYKDAGMHIYRLTELNKETINSPLGKVEQARNRTVLEELHSLSSVKDKVSILVQMALELSEKKKSRTT